MPAVLHDDPVGGQQRVQPPHRAARIEPAVGGERVTVGAADDALAWRDGPPGRPDHAERVAERPHDFGGVSAQERGHTRVRRLGREIHLDDVRLGGERRTEARRERIEARTQDEHDIRLLDGRRGDLGGEPAADAERGVSVEEAHRESASSR